MARRQPAQPSLVRTIAPSAVLVGLALLAYLPAVRAGFIWDDPDYVTQNATLRSLDGLRQIWLSPRSLPQWYPMVHSTFWIEYQLWGLWPAGYHVVNILLHAANAVLLFAILRKLKAPAAWLAAAVFALHPVHVESVAWVTERKNVLSGLFYLAAMLVYLHFVGARLVSPSIADEAWATQVSPLRWRSYALALLLFCCALLSKTVTCSLPAAILLAIWWKRGRLARRDVTPLIPFFLLGAGLALLTSHFEKEHVGATGAEFDFSPIDRLLIAGRAVWFYLWKLIAPVNLSFIYPRWDIDADRRWLLAFPIVAILTIVALFALRRRIGRGPLVAILFFGGTLLPALGFVNVYPMRYSFVADHFQYLASIGPIVLLAAAGQEINSSRTYLISRFAAKISGYAPHENKEINSSGSYLFRALVGAVIVLLGMLTFQQARLYLNTETLWRDTAAKNPNSWMVHTNLGHALVERKDYKAAQEQYEIALKLAPHLPEPHWNVGIGLSVRGDDDGALRRFDEAIRLEPRFPQGYYSRGNVYRERGQLDEAIAQYEKAIALKKDYAEAYYNLGVIAETRKRPDEAIRYYGLAVANKLDYADAHYNLANVLRERGRLDEALVHYSQVIRIDPRRADAHANLGWTFLQMGRYEEARQAFAAALAIDPNLLPARRGMQRALRLRGP